MQATPQTNQPIAHEPARQRLPLRLRASFLLAAITVVIMLHAPLALMAARIVA